MANTDKSNKDTQSNGRVKENAATEKGKVFAAEMIGKSNRLHRQRVTWSNVLLNKLLCIAAVKGLSLEFLLPPSSILHPPFLCQIKIYIIQNCWCQCNILDKLEDRHNQKMWKKSA